MDDGTMSWLATVAGVTVVLGIFCFTGSSCEQHSAKLTTERFNACVAAGGSWVPGRYEQACVVVGRQ